MVTDQLVRADTTVFVISAVVALPPRSGVFTRFVADHPLDRAQDAVVRGALAEMVEHHRARPDGCDRVRDPFARDIGAEP
jgi:hypothetical protein